MLQLANLDPMFVWLNRAEGILWIAIGVVIWFWARRRDRGMQRVAVWTIALLVAFGVSDFVEATTGAWWRPWWLLAWKAACALGLVWLFLRLARSSRNRE